MPESPPSNFKIRIRHFVGALLPCVIAWLFLWFAIAQRQEIFSRLEYGLIDNNNWLPHAFGFVAIVWLGFQIRKLGIRSVKSVIPTMTFILTIAAFTAILIGKSPWVRYRIYRVESRGSHWCISSLTKERTCEDLVGRLSDPGIGPWLCDDKEMLLDLVVFRAPLFARKPLEARAALTSLIRLGSSVGEIASMGKGHEFLCYALASETDPNPWDDLDWLKHPQTTPSPSNEFHAGAFTRKSAAKLVLSQLALLETISESQLEAMFFCSLAFTDLLGDNENGQIQNEWSERAGKLGALLDEGFRLRDQVTARLPKSAEVLIHLETEEENVIPIKAKRNGIMGSLNRSVRMLLNSTGKEIQYVEAEESDVKVKLTISGQKLYEYQQTLYETKTRYEKGRVDVFRGRLYSRSGRNITESVPNGTATRNVYGAAVALKIQFHNDPDSDSDRGNHSHHVSDPIETDETLAYWSDFRTKDGAKNVIAEFSHEQLSGRIWPFGIHESYFQRRKRE